MFDRDSVAGPADVPVDSVSMDNRAAGYIATRHLIELGHTRIGYISGPTPTASRRERFEAIAGPSPRSGIAVDGALTPSVPASSGYDDTHGAELGRAIAS